MFLIRPFAASRKRASRGGYTLLELLLVLAVLAVAMGLAWPNIESMHKRQRLQSAADEVQRRLAGTRIRAIDAGVVLEFRYEAGGRGFAVVATEPVDSAGTTGTLASGELPEPLRFEPVFDLAAGESPSGSIPFVPDGTATDAALDVVDDEDLSIRVSVRGLTAAAAVGQIRPWSGR